MSKNKVACIRDYVLVDGELHRVTVFQECHLNRSVLRNSDNQVEVKLNIKVMGDINYIVRDKPMNRIMAFMPYDTEFLVPCEYEDIARDIVRSLHLLPDQHHWNINLCYPKDGPKVLTVFIEVERDSVAHFRVLEAFDPYELMVDEHDLVFVTKSSKVVEEKMVGNKSSLPIDISYQISHNSGDWETMVLSTTEVLANLLKVPFILTMDNILEELEKAVLKDGSRWWGGEVEKIHREVSEIKPSNTSGIRGTAVIGIAIQRKQLEF